MPLCVVRLHDVRETGQCPHFVALWTKPVSLWYLMRIICFVKWIGIQTKVFSAIRNQNLNKWSAIMVVSFFLRNLNNYFFVFFCIKKCSSFLENVNFRIRNFNKQKYGHCDNHNTIKERPWELPLPSSSFLNKEDYLISVVTRSSFLCSSLHTVAWKTKVTQ